MILQHIILTITIAMALAPELPAQTRQAASAPARALTDVSRRDVPPFAAVSLDDSTRAITGAMLRGRVFLVDFWATWCPPCVEELPALTSMYKEFSPAGFEIVGISLDKTDERIQEFRRKRFAMPWLHIRAAGGFSDVLLAMFGVQNIPHAVLVDRDGRIVAEGEDLRNGGLERRLRELFPVKTD
jgi:thiol-disulfide isomerase/thioredoxin